MVGGFFADSSRVKFLGKKNIFWVWFLVCSCLWFEFLEGVDVTRQVRVAVDVAHESMNLIDELLRRIDNGAVLLHRRCGVRMNRWNVNHILPATDLVLEIHEAEVGEKNAGMIEEDVVHGECPCILRCRVIDDHLGCVDLSDGTQVNRIRVLNGGHLEVQRVSPVETVAGTTCARSRRSCGVVNEVHGCLVGCGERGLTSVRGPFFNFTSRTYPDHRCHSPSQTIFQVEKDERPSSQVLLYKEMSSGEEEVSLVREHP